MGECWQQKHTQHSPSTKTECDYLSGWIKNGHIRKNLTQNGEPQRYSWGTEQRFLLWLAVQSDQRQPIRDVVK